MKLNLNQKQQDEAFSYSELNAIAGHSARISNIDGLFKSKS